MNCSNYRCPANCNYYYGSERAGGVCCIESTSPEMLDQYAENCGFIRVTDSWTLWKFGVLFKELTCGNCQNYVPGEYSHGTCIADIEFGYGGNARFNGAHACKEFKNKEGEKLAKNTYWTKCGVEFTKSINAAVTGYKVDESNSKCGICPYRNAVTKGYPAVFDHWECRAGSKQPNHKTEWVGSLEDKNPICINSLDHELMEDIRQFCTDHPDLYAGYNPDHLADCRRTLSIGCSSNKKGLAAKKTLIEKFFPDRSESDIPLLCINCISCKPAGHGEGHPFQHKCYNASHRVGFEFYFGESSIACKNFVPAGDASYEGIESMDLENQLDCLLKDGDRKDKEIRLSSTRACGKCNAGHWYSEDNTYVSVVADDGIKTTKHPCEPHTHYCYQFAEGQKKIAADIDFNPDTAPEWCPMEKDVKYTHEADLIENPIAPLEQLHKPEKKKPRIGTKTGCNEMREDCPYFCKHNDGCSVLLIKGNTLKAIIEKSGDIDCDVYKKVVERVNNKPENNILDSVSRFIKGQESENETTEIDVKSDESVTFDYSTVDENTAVFLQEKASKITEIRIKSVLAIGKELKEAQDKLANNKNGTFGAWATSIGMSRQTAYNYINGYEFIAKNFDNIEAAEDLSPSLLFAASKKDAPQELQQGVISGDITSLKEYKDLEKKLAEAEKRAKEAEFHYKTVDQSYKNLEKTNHTHYIERQNAEIRTKKAESKIKLLANQLEQAKTNSDFDKVQELQDEIDSYQKQIGGLNTQISDLKKQLKDKPIEVPAVKEVIPTEVRLAIFEKVTRLVEGLSKLTDAEIEIFAEDVCEDYRNEALKSTDDASEVLADIAHAIWKLTQ